MFILERTDMGVTPQTLLKLLDHAEIFLKANKNFEKCEIIEEIDLQDGNPVAQVYSCQFRPPAAFIAGRVLVDAKYTITDEMMCLMSSEGNDKELEIYLQEKAHELKGMSPAFCRLTALKFFPVLDHDQNVVGTSVIMAAQFDYGGSIPKWFINKAAPQNILSFYEEFISMSRNQID